jgi:hypothetical protein
VSKVRITADGLGRGTVHVDGHEMSNDVRGVSFNAWAGDSTEVELHLIIHDAMAELIRPKVIRDPHATVSLVDDVCPCFAFEEYDEGSQTCACGHEMDEHNQRGECEVDLVGEARG